MCTIRTLAPTDGMRVGLYYTGQWYGRFESNGRQIMESDLKSKPGSATHPISCVNHRMEISFSLLKSLKKQEPQKAKVDAHEAD